MANYQTPGVYVEEISTLPASVASVPTAITGFVGRTQIGPLNAPTRITSMLEYEAIFGGPDPVDFTATLTDGPVVSVAPTSGLSECILYYQVQMFYANGGGVCYIVSCGNYASSLDASDITFESIPKFEQIDEVTILCVPEAVFFTNLGERKQVYDAMLAQCNLLKDRFAVMDMVHAGNNTILQDADNFRNNDVGIDNLKYGAAYYPAIKSTLNYAYQDSDVTIDDQRTAPSPDYDGDTLDVILNGDITPATTSIANINILDFSDFTTGNKFTLNTVELVIPGDFIATGSNEETAQNLYNAILAQVPSVNAVLNGTTINLTALVSGTTGNITLTTTAVGTAATVANTNGTNAVVTKAANKGLYNAVAAELNKFTVDLYPSGSMAGIYARVDNSRGVWKAPANVGIASISGPTIPITDADQEKLNVDSVSGKSINAIRTFTGRGTIVWGARTLAGNDNEWRYINVRRLFNYAEESIKKATEFVVFEANTASTWNRTKGMIEAFLNQLWKDGGLAGATAKDAFYVNVGLGSTMTAQDILEGRMIIDIGLAAVRPAEFIVLRFMHKLQES